MRQALIVAIAVALLAALEAAYFVARWFSDRRAAELKRRLQAIGKGGTLDSSLLRRGRFAASAAMAELVSRLPAAGRIEALLEQADAPLTVAQLFTVSSALAAAALVGAFAMRGDLLAKIALPLGGFALPVAGLLVRRARRSQKLSEQLPEALDMMARSLKAGHALPASFQVVAGEMPQPISIEFARAFEEQKLGRSLEEAVQQMSGRAPDNGDLKIFAVSTVIQRETGGNLAEIMEKIAETIRERYRFFGKLRSLTAEGKVSGLILGSLPIGVSLLISLTNRTYFVRLFDNPKGQLIFAFAIASWIAGIFWMWRLTKMEI